MLRSDDPLTLRSTKALALRDVVALLGTVALTAGVASAQFRDNPCGDGNWNSDRASHCEAREATIGGGDLRGETTNGGVTIDLRGDHWDGAGLDVETHNGGIRMTMPANYSAQLETGTTNGRINIDFPITAQGSLGRQLTTILGAGGARIRAITT